MSNNLSKGENIGNRRQQFFNATKGLLKKYCTDVSGSNRSYFQGSADLIAFQNDCIGRNASSFVGVAQNSSDKTGTTLRSSSIVAIPVYVLFLHIKAASRRFPLDHWYKFQGLLPVSASTAEHEEPEEQMERHKFEKDWYNVGPSDVLSSGMRKGSEKLERQSIHESVSKLLQPWKNTVNPDLFQLVSWNVCRYHSTLIYFRWDIFEGKDTCTLEYSGTACPCMRSLTITGEIFDFFFGYQTNASQNVSAFENILKPTILDEAV